MFHTAKFFLACVVALTGNQEAIVFIVNIAVVLLHIRPYVYLVSYQHASWVRLQHVIFIDPDI